MGKLELYIPVGRERLRCGMEYEITRFILEE